MKFIIKLCFLSFILYISLLTSILAATPSKQGDIQDEKKEKPLSKAQEPIRHSSIKKNLETKKSKIIIKKVKPPGVPKTFKSYKIQQIKKGDKPIIKVLQTPFSKPKKIFKEKNDSKGSKSNKYGKSLRNKLLNKHIATTFYRRHRRSIPKYYNKSNLRNKWLNKQIASAFNRRYRRNPNRIPRIVLLRRPFYAPTSALAPRKPCPTERQIIRKWLEEMIVSKLCRRHRSFGNHSVKRFYRKPKSGHSIISLLSRFRNLRNVSPRVNPRIRKVLGRKEYKRLKRRLVHILKRKLAKSVVTKLKHIKPEKIKTLMKPKDKANLKIAADRLYLRSLRKKLLRLVKSKINSLKKRKAIKKLSKEIKKTEKLKSIRKATAIKGRDKDSKLVTKIPSKRNSKKITSKKVKQENKDANTEKKPAHNGGEKVVKNVTKKLKQVEKRDTEKALTDLKKGKTHNAYYF